MDPKMVRYFPLGLGMFTALRELLALVFYYKFNILYYIFQGRIDANPRVIGCIIALLIRILFVLACLYSFKLYTDNNIKRVRVVSAFMLIHILVMFTGGSQPALGQLILFGMFLNLIISVITPENFDSSKPSTPKFFQTQQTNYFPVQNNSSQRPKDLVEQLEALNQLKESGALSEAEFIAAKQRIIGS